MNILKQRLKLKEPPKIHLAKQKNVQIDYKDNFNFFDKVKRFDTQQTARKHLFEWLCKNNLFLSTF